MNVLPIKKPNFKSVKSNLSFFNCVYDCCPSALVVLVVIIIMITMIIMINDNNNDNDNNDVSDIYDI